MAPNPASSVGEYDPRDWVTEAAFRVQEGLLGRPLAKPWRRAVALALDGIAIAILAAAPGLLFGIAAALVLLRASARPAVSGIFRRSALFMTRSAAAVVTLLVVVSLWNRVGDLGAPSPPPPAEVTGGNVISGFTMGAGILALTRADNEAEALRQAEGIASTLQEAGFSGGEVDDILAEVPRSAERPWINAALDSVRVHLATAPATPAAERSVPELVSAYQAATAAGDEAAAAGAGRALGVALARDSIATLETSLQRQASRVDALQGRLRDREGASGVLALFNQFREDLGLGFGWGALYFTAWTVLGRGRTPGKRLLRLRVVRLDGRPIGWWAAFERFAGYAAGLATGLLGFLQIFWDPNRQAIHDKISRTVVLHE